MRREGTVLGFGALLVGFSFLALGSVASAQGPGFPATAKDSGSLDIQAVGGKSPVDELKSIAERENQAVSLLAGMESDELPDRVRVANSIFYHVSPEKETFFFTFVDDSPEATARERQIAPGCATPKAVSLHLYESASTVDGEDSTVEEWQKIASDYSCVDYKAALSSFFEGSLKADKAYRFEVRGEHGIGGIGATSPGPSADPHIEGVDYHLELRWRDGNGGFESKHYNEPPGTYIVGHPGSSVIHQDITLNEPGDDSDLPVLGNDIGIGVFEGADGRYLAVSVFGDASSRHLAVSGFGDTNSPASASGFGHADSRWVAVNGDGSSDADFVAVGALGNTESGFVAVSGGGDSTSRVGPAASLTGESEGRIALSVTGDANERESCWAERLVNAVAGTDVDCLPTVAISGTGNADGDHSFSLCDDVHSITCT